MPNDENSDVQIALRRMTEIGWVKGYAYSPERGFVIDWTAEGVTQIGGLHLFPHQARKNHRPASLEWTRDGCDAEIWKA